jgi:hypothetical protein
MASKQSSIVKQAEIVPQVNQSALRLTLNELEIELAVVSEWNAKAEALKVTNPAEFKAAGEFRAEVRSQRKVAKFKLQPFQEIAKQVTDFLKSRRTEAEAEFDKIDLTITGKMDEHARLERMAAEAEEKRINDARIKAAQEKADAEAKAAKAAVEAKQKQEVAEINRKLRAGEVGKREAARLLKLAGDNAMAAKLNADMDAEDAKNAPPPPVSVKPNLPAITGSRRHRNYYAEFTNFPALLEAWRQARNNGSLERAVFLATFITGDEGALAKEARDTRDSKVMETQVPGIHAWDVDKT